MAQHVYHWKHGWIPLDHTAALSKAKGNHDLAATYLRDARSPGAGIHSRQDVAKALLGVPKISDAGDRKAALDQVGLAARAHIAQDLLPGKPKSASADLAHMSSDDLDAEVTKLAAAGDFGPRMEALAAEMDRRETAAPAHVPDKPDPMAEQRALNKLLYGAEDPAALDLTKRRGAPSRNREAALRDEYHAWAMTNYFNALEDTAGNFYNNKASRLGNRPFDEVDFFNGKASPAQIRKYGSEELLVWFGKNPRMSYDEWRSGIVDDKRARSAHQRLSERTLSQWG